MRFNLKPFKTLKALAVTTSVFSMCITPLAQGAQAANQKAMINQYLKETGLTTKRMTVGEYWQSVRHAYPEKMQKALDEWARHNRNELMPAIEATTYKASNGTEQVRLNLVMGSGKAMTIAFTGDEEKPLKINSVTFANKDFANFDKVVAMLAEDPAIKKSMEGPREKVTPSNGRSAKKALNGREIAQLPLRQQVDYLLRMRLASEAADRVLDSAAAKPKKGASFEFINGDAVSYVWNMLLTPANALSGKCVASGWIASYHNNSCARPNPGRETLLNQTAQLPFSPKIKEKVTSCVTGGGLPCNPMIFGFKDNDGTPYCVTSDLKSATNQCNSKNMSPLNSAQDKEKIIKSIVAAKGGDPSLCSVQGEKNVSDACSKALGDYTDSLRSHFMNAASFCTKDSVASIDQRDSWVTRPDVKPDQIDACENLKKRFFDLQVNLTPPPSPKIDDCDKTYAQGSSMDNNGKCVCPDGKPPVAGKDGGAKPDAKPVSASSKPAKIADQSGTPPAPGEGGYTESGSDGSKMVCGGAVGGSGEIEKPAKEECTNFFCKNKGLLIGLGVALAFGLLAWWLWPKKSKKKKSTAETVAPVPETTPTATGTVISTPDPNPNPCIAPNTLVNGVCSAPSVVEVVPPTATEGGTTTGTIYNGGTR